MGSPLADVELITLALEVLEKLGLKDIELRLSHAGLTRGILQRLGLNAEEQHQVFDRLLDGDAAVLAQIKTERPELAPLLALQGKSSGFVKNLASSLNLDLPELKLQIDDFVYIADTLQALGHEFQIDIASVRGFEYYTGVIFQLFVNDEKVGGGGRYDALIPSMGGQDRPASGFALYVDQLMQSACIETLNQAPVPRLTLKIEEGANRIGFETAKLLREKGVIVKIHLGGKGPIDAAWKLDVRPNQYILTDIEKNKKYDLKTSAEVLEKIKKQEL
jgi:histidyl-tRNA synthetase